MVRSKRTSSRLFPKIKKSATNAAQQQQHTQGSKTKSSSGTKAPMKRAESYDLNEAENTKKISEMLQRYTWYHGLMPREEIEEMLKEDGDFIIRRTEVGRKSRLVISVKSEKRIRHILVTFFEDRWNLGNIWCRSLPQLIESHVKTQTPVQKDGTLLKHPIPRPDFYILHDHVEVKEKIGAGAFGSVHIGSLKKHDGTKVDVAIKISKGQMSKRQRTLFMKEAKIMRRFHHRNIVNLLGVAPQEHPVMIILELCPNGSLTNKLKKFPTLPAKKLLGYTIDAARGMVYLSNRRVIHRDIAARNCLIGKNDEAKISDFGLSVADQNIVSVDKLRQMPVRWLSPETLRLGQFSTKSDVWSFGVLLWEVFSYCKNEPFPGLTNAQARLKILSRETPMYPPQGTPSSIMLAMTLCFIQEPDRRPTFNEIFQMIAPDEHHAHADK